MKKIILVFAVTLTIAGSAFATDTSTTTAAQGTFPSGTSFSGVNLNGLQIATATVLVSDGSAEGQVTVALMGTTALGVQQTINVDAVASGGSSTAANIVTINGTCAIDLGDGTAPMTGVPFVATITLNANHQGTVGLVLGATALPAATINGGSMSIESLAD